VKRSLAAWLVAAYAICTPLSSRAGEALDPAALRRARCEDSTKVAILATPWSPHTDAPLRVVAVTSEPLDAALIVQGPDGAQPKSAGTSRGASPYWWLVDIPNPVEGTYRAGLGHGADVIACQDIEVLATNRSRARESGVVWPIERAWDRDTENLYSAWVERLFDDPLDAQPSWRGLGQVLGDPGRNFLHDYLGLGEDSRPQRGSHLDPDCADLPYLLRAYFAWKLRLPFGYSECNRGSASSPPRCGEWRSNLGQPPGANTGELSGMDAFLARSVAWTVHSGSARTPAGDDRTDLYPTRFSTDTIRPGTVYADPYGHTLVVVQRIPQSASAGGILLAVDAQPDKTVARKRYWRGNFLFAVDPALGGAGFKRFRPIARERGALHPLTNDEIERDPAYGDFSLEQYADGVDGFYDRMEELLSPKPMDPARVLRETIDALEEQVGARVQSVANGEEYVAQHAGVIPMPEGAAIFETSGPWEDFATPSRDLRLLIAIDVVEDFPARLGRRPERFALPPGKPASEVRAELEKVLRDETRGRTFTYRNSTGSESTLTLADVLARREALEMAYNPNDCVELRWGAPPDGAEAATCHRRAPRAQLARMDEYRTWFRERRRPPRP
jgi:hypothetical protein